MQDYRRRILYWMLFVLGVCGTPGRTLGLTDLSRTNPYYEGETLVYEVKYGFVTLGTLEMETGGVGKDGNAVARLKFWTSDVPFLHTQTTVEDVLDTRDNTIVRYLEHTRNGDDHITRRMSYDRARAMLTYSDDSIRQRITEGVAPFCDALGLVYSVRMWSGSGKTYRFSLRDKLGAHPVMVQFSNHPEPMECAALDGKSIRTYVAHGQADMGGASPLGADGDFTFYVTSNEAAIPVRIEMKIAIGSITLELVKVKGHPGWTSVGQ